VPMTNRQPPVQHPDESVGIEVVRSSESQQVVATLSAGSTPSVCARGNSPASAARSDGSQEWSSGTPSTGCSEAEDLTE
jgi:hypothetical protein